MSQMAVYTTSQVAQRAFVDASTVRLWVKTGVLAPLLTTPGGHYRFDKKLIDERFPLPLSTLPAPAVAPSSPEVDRSTAGVSSSATPMAAPSASVEKSADQMPKGARAA